MHISKRLPFFPESRASKSGLIRATAMHANIHLRTVRDHDLSYILVSCLRQRPHREFHGLSYYRIVDESHTGDECMHC